MLVMFVSYVEFKNIMQYVLYTGPLSVGAIAGIAVGGVLIIAIIIVVLFCFGKH